MEVNTEMTNSGWQCPICNAVFAPFVSECKHCKRKEEYPELVKLDTTVNCTHDWQILCLMPPQVQCKKCHETKSIP